MIKLKEPYMVYDNEKVVSAVNVNWVIGGFGFLKEGSKIGELTFWYSKCEKGIYRIESHN